MTNPIVENGIFFYERGYSTRLEDPQNRDGGAGLLKLPYSKHLVGPVSSYRC